MAYNPISFKSDGTTGINNRPIFSIYSIFDIDVAVILYTVENLKNDKVFDFSRVEGLTIFNLIGEIYKRKYKNPLYFLMRNESDKEFIDDCYNELITIYEKEVLKYVLSTEIYEYILFIKSQANINSTIFYYTDAELEFLESDEKLSDFKFVPYQYLDPRLNNYDSVYFKFVTESDKFKNIKFKSIYFSTTGLNLTEDNSNIIESDYMMQLAYNRCFISLFDIYKMDLIGRYYENKEEENNN